MDRRGIGFSDSWSGSGSEFAARTRCENKSAEGRPLPPNPDAHILKHRDWELAPRQWRVTANARPALLDKQPPGQAAGPAPAWGSSAPASDSHPPTDPTARAAPPACAARRCARHDYALLIRDARDSPSLGSLAQARRTPSGRPLATLHYCEAEGGSWVEGWKDERARGTLRSSTPLFLSNSMAFSFDG
jgi:hypothetical protein